MANIGHASAALVRQTRDRYVAEAQGGDVDPAPRGPLWAWLSRFRDSQWSALALRVLGAGGLMLALAAIGAVSMRTLPSQGAIYAPEPAHSGEWLRPVASAKPGAGQAAPKTATHNKPPTPNSEQQGSNHSPAPNPCDKKPPQRPAGLTEDGKVILNLASVAEFDRLPGVGKKRAEAIVKLRTRLKRFRRVSDLLRIRGIGIRSLRKMKPYLVLDPPKPVKPETDASKAP